MSNLPGEGARPDPAAGADSGAARSTGDGGFAEAGSSPEAGGSSEAADPAEARAGDAAAGEAGSGADELAERLKRMMAGFAEAWTAGAGSAAETGAGASGAAVEAMGALAGKVRFDPNRMLDAQMQLWQDYQRLWMGTTAKLLGQEPPEGAVIESEPDDHRFRDAEWTENPVFDYVRQSYLLNAAWAKRMVESIGGLDADAAQKLDFFSRQIVDAMAPTNFALTNPAVLRETAERGGENLRQGYRNLAAVLAKGQGPLAIEQVDRSAFEVGVAVAVTPGEVVFQNDLLQLIQYAPATETVYQRPLLIVPPWINKYYILDLRESNSFVGWCVGQGYTVFMVSWVNPDERHRDRTFDDYLRDGLLVALDAIERETGEKDVTAVGYCIGGTLLAIALAWLGARGEERIRAATFFAAQVDFAEGGELRVFTDPATLQLIEGEVERRGFLEGSSMAAAFNLLRARDLVWHFAIESYLMGKSPPAFDLLYWNADSTRFPARLLFDYLRGMYQENRLSTPGAFEVLGQPIDLADVRIPVYLQAARQDHIAPAASVFKAMNLFTGPRRFVLAGSGHIAGVVNPPEKGKYQHWINPARKQPRSLDDWLQGAEEHPGSWWPDWHRWLSRRSGRQVAARTPGAGGLAPIEPAPGSYVKVRYDS